MKDFKKLWYETMPFDELVQRLTKMSADIHKRQAALDKEKNDLDIISDIYIRRIEQDDELKKAYERLMKSL